MNKIICLFFLVCFFVVNIYAADNNVQKEDSKVIPVKVDRNSDTFKNQMKELENKRRQLSMKMYQLRVKLITESSDLLMLHGQIMKLHKQLAIELNKDSEMRNLIRQSEDIDNQIQKMFNPVNNNEKVNKIENQDVKTDNNISAK